jgi:hypothetical protein
MQWYIAKIIFRIVCGQGNHTPQFDEQVRIVAAQNDQYAFNKAREIGRQESTSFYNHDQQLVEWKFIDVTELYKMTELIDGAELFSRIHETDDADNYIDLVHLRAAFARQYNGYEHLQLLSET